MQAVFAQSALFLFGQERLVSPLTLGFAVAADSACQLACGSYCIAIAHLINNPRDAAGAIEAARQWLQRGLAQQADSSTATELNSSQIASSGSCSSRGCEPHGAQASDLAKADAVCWKTVLSWLTDATVQASGPGPAVHEQAGFLKWGFVHAFRWGVLLFAA